MPIIYFAFTIIIIGLFIWKAHPILVSILERAFKNIVFRIKTDEKIIALSIDDSPHPDVTPNILDILNKFQVRGTFFIIGNYADKHPKLVADIVAKGHEIGNHTMEDRPAFRLTALEFKKDLKETETNLMRFQKLKLFRPGSGLISRKQIGIVKELGYTCCLGDLYFNDPRITSVSLISWLILRYLRPGSIIILHDGKSERVRTVKILQNILPKIINRGYRITTISELLHHKTKVGADA